MSGVDGGTTFGTWGDETSRLIYHDAMPTLLSGVDTSELTLDLGGGNGLLREWFPHLVTVDSDPTKRPDIIADITRYTPRITRYHLVVLRYVLHYLNDVEVEMVMRHLAAWHHGDVLVIQFVNDDLKAKLTNSVNETKFFRTEHQLAALLGPWEVHRRIAVGYDVHPDFYRNRLGHPNPTGHREAVIAYSLR